MAVIGEVGRVPGDSTSDHNREKTSPDEAPGHGVPGQETPGQSENERPVIRS